MGWQKRFREQGPSVFIGIPTMGHIHQRLAGLLIKLASEYRNGLYIHMVANATPVDYARNIMVDAFLQTPLEWLLMIDDDIVPPENVLDLTRTLNPATGGKCLVVGGVCLTISEHGTRSTIFQRVPEQPGMYRQHPYCNDSGTIEVDATGTGCIAIHRTVLEKMQQPYFEFLFDTNRKIKTGEDIRFCEKAIQAGFPIYVNKSIRCGHYKSIDLLWHNDEVVNYMSPDKVETLIDNAIKGRVTRLEKQLALAS